jgi:UrcA family protein
MRARSNPRLGLSRPVSVAIVLGLAAGFAAQLASAQTTSQETYVGPEVAEVVITPLPRGDRDVQRLSRVVSYADLDLTTAYGQRELQWRVRDTARSICRRLGEGAGGDCQREAIRNARPQLAFAVRRAYARAAEARAYASLAPNAPYVAPLYD